MSFSKNVLKKRIRLIKEIIKKFKRWKILVETYGGIKETDEAYFTICVVKI